MRTKDIHQGSCAEGHEQRGRELELATLEESGHVIDIYDLLKATKHKRVSKAESKETNESETSEQGFEVLDPPVSGIGKTSRSSWHDAVFNINISKSGN